MEENGTWSWIAIEAAAAVFEEETGATVELVQKNFEDIRAEFSDFAAKLRVKDMSFIPVSALPGDNVVTLADEYPSNLYPWLQQADRGDHIALGL